MPPVRSIASAPLLVGLLVLAGCASAGHRPAHSGPSSLERGVASWYGPGFDGRMTASGERYDMHALTAAHRTLPFGTIVEVTREDGRSVRVRINDRGPFGKSSRIIDLSRAAAAQLGMLRDGVVRVTVRVIGR